MGSMGSSSKGASSSGGVLAPRRVARAVGGDRAAREPVERRRSRSAGDAARGDRAGRGSRRPGRRRGRRSSWGSAALRARERPRASGGAAPRAAGATCEQRRDPVVGVLVDDDEAEAPVGLPVERVRGAPRARRCGRPSRRRGRSGGLERLPPPAQATLSRPWPRRSCPSSSPLATPRRRSARPCGASSARRSTISSWSSSTTAPSTAPADVLAAVADERLRVLRNDDAARARRRAERRPRRRSRDVRGANGRGRRRAPRLARARSSGASRPCPLRRSSGRG